MASGSKYETLANTIKQKLELLGANADDIVKQKQLEAELQRIDKETEQRIEEIKATPIDTELIKQQAKAELENTIRENKRTKTMKIAKSEEVVTDCEAGIREGQEELRRLKRDLEMEKERFAEEEATSNLKAQQEYERTISSIGNSEKSMELKINREKQDGERRKSETKIRLDNIKAKNDAQKEKMDCIERLYKDIKEISLKLGESQKTQS